METGITAEVNKTLGIRTTRITVQIRNNLRETMDGKTPATPIIRTLPAGNSLITKITKTTVSLGKTTTRTGTRRTGTPTIRIPLRPGRTTGIRRIKTQTAAVLGKIILPIEIRTRITTGTVITLLPRTRAIRGIMEVHGKIQGLRIAQIHLVPQPTVAEATMVATPGTTIMEGITITTGLLAAAAAVRTSVQDLGVVVEMVLPDRVMDGERRVGEICYACMHAWVFGLSTLPSH